MAFHTLCSLILVGLIATDTWAHQCKEVIRSGSGGYEVFNKVEYLNHMIMDPKVSFEMHVAIQAERDAHILLSPIPNPTYQDSVYEIVLGAGRNTFNDLRRNMKDNSLYSGYMSDVLSTTEFRSFYIKIYKDGLIEIGKEGEAKPFISYTDKNVLQIKYYSFAAYDNVLSRFVYDCPPWELEFTTPSEMAEQKSGIESTFQDYPTTESTENDYVTSETTTFEAESTFQDYPTTESTENDYVTTESTTFEAESTFQDYPTTESTENDYVMTETTTFEAESTFQDYPTTESTENDYVMTETTTFEAESTFQDYPTTESTENDYVTTETTFATESTENTYIMTETTFVTELDQDSTEATNYSTTSEEFMTYQNNFTSTESTSVEYLNTESMDVTTTAPTTDDLTTEKFIPTNKQENKDEQPHISASITIEHSGTVSASLGPLTLKETSLVPKFGILIAAIAKDLHGGYGSFYSPATRVSSHNGPHHVSNVGPYNFHHKAASNCKLVPKVGPNGDFICAPQVDPAGALYCSPKRAPNGDRYCVPNVASNGTRYCTPRVTPDDVPSCPPMNSLNDTGMCTPIVNNIGLVYCSTNIASNGVPYCPPLVLSDGFRYCTPKYGPNDVPYCTGHCASFDPISVSSEGTPYGF